MTRVERRSNASFDALLKRFRKKVARDRVLSEATKHRYLVSNSEKRRLALQKAVRRQNKRQRRQEQRGITWRNTVERQRGAGTRFAG